MTARLMVITKFRKSTETTLRAEYTAQWANWSENGKIEFLLPVPITGEEYEDYRKQFPEHCKTIFESGPAAEMYSR